MLINSLHWRKYAMHKSCYCFKDVFAHKTQQDWNEWLAGMLFVFALGRMTYQSKHNINERADGSKNSSSHQCTNFAFSHCKYILLAHETCTSTCTWNWKTSGLLLGQKFIRKILQKCSSNQSSAGFGEHKQQTLQWRHYCWHCWQI